jgi:LemA protein
MCTPSRDCRCGQVHYGGEVRSDRFRKECLVTAFVVAIIVALVVLVAIIAGMYNALIRRRNQVDNAWSQIDVQIKRRHDLIPNLIDTVKGYMKFEQETLTNVTKARQMAVDAGAQGPQAQAAAENALTQTLRSLFAVVENYPDLKANQNVMALQEELTATENKISFARQFYNDSVMSFCMMIQTFPSNVIASLFSFKERQFFQADEADKVVPKVDLTLS